MGGGDLAGALVWKESYDVMMRGRSSGRTIHLSFQDQFCFALLVFVTVQVFGLFVMNAWSLEKC
jgi:hypothetical protein